MEKSKDIETITEFKSAQMRKILFSNPVCFSTASCQFLPFPGGGNILLIRFFINQHANPQKDNPPVYRGR